MFRVTNNTVTGPVTTAVFGALPQNVNTTTALEEFRANDLNTKATLGAMISVLATTAVKDEPTGTTAEELEEKELINNCKSMFLPAIPETWNRILNETPADPPTESDTLNTAIRLNLPQAPKWLVNFINAAKKKPLDDNNVEGWFAEMGHTATKGAPVASFINRITPFFPDNISDANFRDRLAPGIWSKYRQTRVSAGNIMAPLLEDFRHLGITTADDEVETAITNSRDNPWSTEMSLEIHSKYKAYAALYLEVSGRPIDQWHQGNAAVEELPSAKVRKIKDIFRRYLEVKNNTAGIDSINTVAGFRTQVITDTW
jgi:hypothetical protein